MIRKSHGSAFGAQSSCLTHLSVGRARVVVGGLPEHGRTIPLADMSYLAATEMTLGELSWKSKAKRSSLPAHRAAWVPQSPKKWHWQAPASFSCSPATKTS